MRLLLVFSLILLVLICGDMFQVFSEAPTTPKILATRDGNREVYMMNPDGSEQVNLTQHPAGDLGAVWSPTGEQILFVSDRQGTRARDLYLMDPDGSNVRRVFKKKTTDWRGNATWSGPMENSLLTSLRTGRVQSPVSILGRLEKQMPNTSGMVVPLRGLPMVQKSPTI